MGGGLWVVGGRGGNTSIQVIKKIYLSFVLRKETNTISNSPQLCEHNIPNQSKIPIWVIVRIAIKTSCVM